MELTFLHCGEKERPFVWEFKVLKVSVWCLGESAPTLRTLNELLGRGERCWFAREVCVDVCDAWLKQVPLCGVVTWCVWE